VFFYSRPLFNHSRIGWITPNSSVEPQIVAPNSTNRSAVNMPSAHLTADCDDGAPGIVEA
jgi:hypothetical protein